jgi:hypothetical protein
MAQFIKGLDRQQTMLLPFHISFIANIARKRPELNRDKTNHLQIGTQADNKRDDWEFAAGGVDFDLL